MAASQGPRDQRKFERIPASLTISYRLLDEDEGAPKTAGPSKSPPPEFIHVHDAMTKDFSMGGFALVGDRPFPLGRKVEVSFQLPSYREGLKFTAEVMRSEPFTDQQRTRHRGGFQILSIDPEDLGYIEKHLHLLKKIQSELKECLKDLKKA